MGLYQALRRLSEAPRGSSRLPEAPSVSPALSEAHWEPLGNLWGSLKLSEYFQSPRLTEALRGPLMALQDLLELTEAL